MSRWLCNYEVIGFTVGKVYEEINGYLIDDQNNVRLKPEYYEEFIKVAQDGSVATEVKSCGKCHNHTCKQCFPEKYPSEEPTYTFIDPAGKEPDFSIVAHYKVQNTEEDFIDTSYNRMSQEEFCGAMKFYIGKYLDRLGKKDDIVQELTKVADVSLRFLAKEKLRASNSKKINT